VGVDKGAELRYSMQPNAGSIAPGKRQLVQLCFVPTQEKVLNYRFTINIKENPKALVIMVRGQGSSINLHMASEQLKIGPVLPYDNHAFQVLSITNTSEHDTELFSLDFDPVYRKEETALRTYERLQNSEAVFTSVRGPGEAFWSHISSANAKKAQREALELELKSLEGA